MQKLRGTERNSIYPISQSIRSKKAVSYKRLFDDFFLGKHLEVRKRPTKGISFLREEEIPKLQLMQSERISPFKIKDENVLEYPTFNFKWYRRFRKKRISLYKRRNKVRKKYKNLNTHRFKSYKGDIRKLPASVFNSLMTSIFEGIFKNEYKFQLPEKRGYIMAVLGKTTEYSNKKILERFKVKQVGLKQAPMIKIIHTLKNNPNVILKDTEVIPIYDSKWDYKKELLNKYPYRTIKVKTIRDFMPILREKYYDVPRELLTRIVKHGFKMLKIFNYAKLSVHFTKIEPKRNGHGKWLKGYMTSKAFYFNTKRRVDGIVGDITKYYDVAARKIKYHGWHYCALSEEEHKHIMTHRINKQLTIYMSHAMSNPKKYPYIVAVKTYFDVPNAAWYSNSNVKVRVLKKSKIRNKLKRIFTKSITYERGNFKYLWKWNGSRFRTFDNSKLRINLLP